MGTVASSDASHDRWDGARANRADRPARVTAANGAVVDDGGGDAEIEARRIRHERRQAARRRELERGGASERAEQDVGGGGGGDTESGSRTSPSARPSASKKATAAVARGLTKSQHANDVGGRNGAGAVRFELPAPLAKGAVGSVPTSRSAVVTTTAAAATTIASTADADSPPPPPPIKCVTLRRCGDSQVLALPSRRPFEIVTVRERSTDIAPMTLELDNTGDATATVHVYEVQRDTRGRAAGGSVDGGRARPLTHTARAPKSAATNAETGASAPPGDGDGDSGTAATAVSPLYSWQIQSRSAMQVVLGWRTAVHVLLVPPSSAASTGVGDAPKLRVRVSLESWRNANQRRGAAPEPYFARRNVDPSEYDAFEAERRRQDGASSRNASARTDANAVVAARTRANRVGLAREKTARPSLATPAAAAATAAERTREPNGPRAGPRKHSSPAARAKREPERLTASGNRETIERKDTNASADRSSSSSSPSTRASARAQRGKSEYEDGNRDGSAGGGGKDPRPLRAHMNPTGFRAADPARKTRAPVAVGAAQRAPRVDATRTAVSDETRAKSRSRTAPATAPKFAPVRTSSAAKLSENDSTASDRPASMPHAQRRLSDDRERTLAATVVASSRRGADGIMRRGSFESAADYESSLGVASTTHCPVAPRLAPAVPAVDDARHRVSAPTVATAAAVVAPFDASDLRRIVGVLVAFLPSARTDLVVDDRLQARTPSPSPSPSPPTTTTAPPETEVVARRIDEARRRLATIEAEIAFAIEKRDEWRREGVEARREAEAWEERVAEMRRSVPCDASLAAAPAAAVVSGMTRDGTAESLATRLDAIRAVDAARFVASVDANASVEDERMATNAVVGATLASHGTRTRPLDDDAEPARMVERNAANGDDGYEEEEEDGEADDAELWPRRPIDVAESAAPEDAGTDEKKSNGDAAVTEKNVRPPTAVAGTRAAAVAERKHADSSSRVATDREEIAAVTAPSGTFIADTRGGLTAPFAADADDENRARLLSQLPGCDREERQRRQQRDEKHESAPPIETNDASAETSACPERVGDLDEKATEDAHTAPETVATSVLDAAAPASTLQETKDATPRGSDAEVSGSPVSEPCETGDVGRQGVDDASPSSASIRVDAAAPHTFDENFRDGVGGAQLTSASSSSAARSLATGEDQTVGTTSARQQQQQRHPPLCEAVETVAVGDGADEQDGNVRETKEERKTAQQQQDATAQQQQQFWFDFSDSDRQDPAPFREASAPLPTFDGAGPQQSETDGTGRPSQVTSSLPAESGAARDLGADSGSPAVATPTPPADPSVQHDAASASPSLSTSAAAERGRERGTEISDDVAVAVVAVATDSSSGRDTAKDGGADSVREQKHTNEPVGVPSDVSASPSQLPPLSSPPPLTVRSAALLPVEAANGDSKDESVDDGYDATEGDNSDDDDAERDAPCFYVTVDDEDDGERDSGEDEGEYEGDANDSVDLTDHERRPTLFV